MIAESIDKNQNMKLEEFRASRDRLENEGIQAMGRIFSKHKSLKVLEIYQNGSKEGFLELVKSLIDCKNTLEYVDISDNKPINNAIPELA